MDFLMVSNHLITAKVRLIFSRNLRDKNRVCIFSKLCMILYLRSSGAGDTMESALLVDASTSYKFKYWRDRWMVSKKHILVVLMSA